MTPRRFCFYRSYLGLPILLALVTFLVFDLTEVDRLFSNMFYDPVAGLFPIGQSHLFEKITHKWARIIPDWTGELAVIGVLLSFIWPCLERYRDARWVKPILRSRMEAPLRFLSRHRFDFFFVMVAFALSTGVIHYLKSHTSIYCPVETTLYGGAEARKEWFDHFVFWHEAGPGRCWPGGHASSAFSLFALYFVARRYRWRHSNVLLAGVIVLGLAYGTTRVLQGWHYMSHTLWAGIFVWLSTLLVALLFYGRSKLQQPVLKAAGSVRAAENQ
ncbi:phosphatidic acid phosphatase [Pseudomonas taetrolens]|uniref:Phosphatidic acid phosphatase n=1 Tax=Pseudomonas taetrolens TaxID=47884 RepID=A0A0J6GMH5_PSETA|nr:phosphatase PAP2 family protein [Pseudomonas taetrolens]KMM83344.1 phosphatidic acid phosphatase [Pseudomonas taetrolens]VEH50181.1 PAP2 superfamily protein [Pseudomonas taetrolens]